VYKLPPELAQNSDVQDGPLPFLLGAKADKIKARYRLEILAEDDKQVQLRVYPKLQDDRQNFVRAELWLAKETYLPTKLAFLEPNHNLVTYQFKQIWTNIEISPSDFKGKRIEGWEIIVQQLAERDDPSRPRR
jgi:outer membrane lipoprotein-sorting protein